MEVKEHLPDTKGSWKQNLKYCLAGFTMGAIGGPLMFGEDAPEVQQEQDDAPLVSKTDMELALITGSICGAFTLYGTKKILESEKINVLSAVFKQLDDVLDGNTITISFQRRRGEESVTLELTPEEVYHIAQTEEPHFHWITDHSYQIVPSLYHYDREEEES